MIEEPESKEERSTKTIQQDWKGVKRYGFLYFL